MNTQAPFVIFTATKSANSPAINEDLMSVMGRQLDARGFSYGYVTEVDSLADEREFFLVQLSSPEQLAAVCRIYQLARHYDQRNVLYVDTNRLASMVYLAEGRGGVDVEREVVLGQFVCLSELEASLRAEYFEDKYGFKYAVNPGASYDKG
jgi:hypothetical protein